MNRIFLVFVGLILSATSLVAQGHKYMLTLDDVVLLAKEQSLQAMQARHSFRAAYFGFMDYKATFLPKLALTTNPTTWEKLIRTVHSVREIDGEYRVVTTEAKANTFSSTAGLALVQNIGFTGGTISLGSDFSRSHNFLQDNPAYSTQFTTTPVRLSISQPLNGYNQFRWRKEIEPLRFEEAKLNYTVQMESVASRAVSMFFSLAIPLSLRMVRELRTLRDDPMPLAAELADQ